MSAISVTLVVSGVATALGVAAVSLLLLRRNAATVATPSAYTTLLAILGAGALMLAGSTACLALLARAPIAFPLPVIGGFVTFSLALVFRGTPFFATYLLRALLPDGNRRRTTMDDRPIRLVVELSLSAFGGVGVFFVFSLLPSNFQTPLLVAALAPFFPFVHQSLTPWVSVLITRKTATVNCYEDIIAMVDDLAEALGVKSVYVSFVPGNLTNAFVFGFGVSHWLVLGEGLLAHLDRDEVKAIAAHEMGHLARGHARKFLLLSCVAALGFTFTLVGVYALWDAGRFVPGALILAAAGSFWNAALPGWFRRRQEYEADLVGAEVLGDPGLVAKALEHLAVATDSDLDRGSVLYPSFRDRIGALNALVT